ncbi:MAG: nuclear transport factor 2 family protein, partial [Sphingopyxis sp.]
ADAFAQAEAFAQEWVAAWNARDLDRILAHYDDDIVFLSPNAAQVIGDGRVEGIAALRAYWGQALDMAPHLHFTLETWLAGHQAMTILYANHRGQRVAESVEFDSKGKVVRSMACHAP